MLIPSITTLNIKNNNRKFKNNIPNFKGEDSLTWNYLYEKSMKKHIYDIVMLNPRNVEDYFARQNVPANFNKGEDNTRKFVAFCCFKTGEIFKQLNYKLPTKIVMDYYDNDYVLGSCFWGPDYTKNYPVRTVVFNANVDLNKMVNIKKNDYNTGYSSSKHFLQTFLHEFAHNLHFDKLFSKWGCPFANQGYIYNPQTIKKMEILNFPIHDEYGNPQKNPFIDTVVPEVMKSSSGYGSTLLPEAFAEEFSRAIINEMDLFSLKLNRNPFPMKIKNSNLGNILYEIWEGLVDDNNGFIKGEN